MEPKLNLSYSRGGGNGIAGLGWGLSGLQRITRGPATVAKDGSFDPVDFDSKDRFFLDGERLVCVNGTYGTDSSEYRTEIDSYARITAVGSGPNYWRVETKAGLTMFLGENSGSRTSVASGVLSWGVSRVMDSVGNFYEVGYSRDAPTGDFDFVNYRVSSISYPPYCTIQFSYEDRPDASRSFSAHSGSLATKRLSKISVLTNGYVNHAYRLAYVNSYQSGRSLLKSVGKYMEDNNLLAVPATTFDYDGLVDDGSDNPLWKESAIRNLPTYGSDLDATSQVNSMVTVDDLRTSIRLTGDVARAYEMTTPFTLTPDTKLQFEVSSSRLNSGAFLGLDSDTSYASSNPIYRIGGAGAVDVNNGNFAGPTLPYNPAEGWKTFTLNIGQAYTGSMKYVVLMCVDNVIADGVDSVVFRNVKLYQSGTQSAANTAPVEFKVGSQLLRYADEEGRDLGVSVLDLDSDGLADMADWRAINFSKDSANKLSPVTLGDAYRNNGTEFVRDTGIRPPVDLPLAVRASNTDASEYNRKHHLAGQPVDVDGDGKLDLMGSVEIVSPAGKISNKYKFHSLVNGAWTEKTGWTLPFTLGNLSSTEGYGGKIRDEHFQWADLNTDGYLDLLIHTSNYGKLYDIVSGSGIATVNSKVAFMNRGRNGPGWIRDDSYALPVRMMVDQKDWGRRLVDLDGDGIAEIAEASDIETAGTRITYRMNGSGNGVAGKWTQQNVDRCHLPASLLNGAQKSEGTLLADLNGDGMIDVYHANYLYSSLWPRVWLNRGNKGGSPWVLEPGIPQGVASESSYSLPVALHFPQDGGMVSYGFEQADINGDGLPDILYSDKTTSARPGPDNCVVINTGTGWRTQGSWGIPGGNHIFESTDTRSKGKRRCKLQDINGDGFPDLITGVIDQTPAVWLNKCKPEVMLSATDGMGSRLDVSYRRLNDPSVINGFDGNNRVYDSTPLAGFPLAAGQATVTDSRLVVSRYSEPDGQGGRRHRAQRYGDLRYDRHNDASLGFGFIEAMDELNGQLTRTETVRYYPFGGSPQKSKTWVYVDPADVTSALPDVTPGRKLMSSEIADYGELAPQVGTGGTIRRPVQTFSEKTLYDLNSAIVSRTTTTQNVADFDAYGFVKKSKVTAYDGSSLETDNKYLDVPANATKWHLGRLWEATVIKKLGSASISKKSSFGYDGNGLLASETIVDNDGQAPDLSVTKSYERTDGFGNITKTTVSTASGSRATHSYYDSGGRFLVREANSLGQVTYDYGDGRKALLLSTTDSGGLTTSFEYDAFGTRFLSHHPDGTMTGEATGYCPAAPAAFASLLVNPVAFYRAQQTSGSATVKVYLDVLGREVATETRIVRDANTPKDLSKVYTASRYDKLGRKYRSYEPFGEGETAANVMTIDYDVVNRVLRTTHPDSQKDEVLTYSTTTLASQPVTYSKVRNRNGSVLERWEDQHGRLAQSKDASGQTTVFKHDVEGRIVEVAILTPPATIPTLLLTNQFDVIGNKTSVWEKNSGTSSSLYNSFGEVTSSTNANGQTTSYAYDALGRVTQVTKPEGIYTTRYDKALGNGIGKPWYVTGPNGYKETISYDAYGRVATSKLTRAITGSFNLESFTSSKTYDLLGRVAYETDAGGLTVLHEYELQTSTALRLSIAAGPTSGTTLWQAGQFDSKGRALTQTLANGVTTASSYHQTTGLLHTLDAARGGVALQTKNYAWDVVGNLLARVDSIAGRLESFTYDSLNRVTSAVVTGSGAPPVASFGYDSMGNLTSKPGASLIYADAGGRPHAVSTATVKGATHVYTYDNAGYLKNDKVNGLDRRSYEWTSFGQLKKLTYEGAPALVDFAGTQIYGPAKVVEEFEFDAGGSRVAQMKTRTAADNTQKIEETTYLGSYERESHSTKTTPTATPLLVKTVHRHSIGGFAAYTTTTPTTGAQQIRLSTILKDHLGSTDAVLTQTWSDSAFATPQTERQSFDTWGERRDPATFVTYRANDADPFRTSARDYDRGYTGHEQLDDSGLIHMNGRIYDPELGRMLSPDPYVQVPEYSQNFNRYSYVMNNPLNLTDPSGFSWLGDLFSSIGSWVKENWRTVVVIVVVALVTYFSFGTLSGAATVWGTALLGTSTAAAAGATATAAVGGAFLGGLAAGLGAKLNGGDFGDVLRAGAIGGAQGGITAGLLHGMSPQGDVYGAGGYEAGFNAKTALHVAGHGLVGGASNAAMGGKFQDGFVSAAVSAAAADVGALSFGGSDSLSVAGRTAMAGIVGGTASAIGGGKFANGAYTAAFQHLLNAEAPEQLDKLLAPNKKLPTNSDLMNATAKFAGNDEAKSSIPPDIMAHIKRGTGPCATLISGALNLISGHGIRSSAAFQTNLGSDGNRYIISAQKMSEYFSARYGRGFLVTADNAQSVSQILAAKPIIYFQPDSRVQGSFGHVGFTKSDALNTQANNVIYVIRDE